MDTNIDIIVRSLDGCEVNSLSQEGVIYVSNGCFYRDGEQLFLKKSHIVTLYREYIENEALD